MRKSFSYMVFLFFLWGTDGYGSDACRVQVEKAEELAKFKLKQEIENAHKSDMDQLRKNNENLVEELRIAQGNFNRVNDECISAQKNPMGALRRIVDEAVKEKETKYNKFKEEAEKRIDSCQKKVDEMSQYQGAYFCSNVGTTAELAVELQKSQKKNEECKAVIDLLTNDSSQLESLKKLRQEEFISDIVDLETKKLRQTVDQLADSKSALESDKKGLQTSLDASERDKKGLQKSLDASESNKKKLQEILDASESDKKKLQEILDALERDKKGLQKSLDASESNKKKLQEILDALESDKKGLQTSLDASERDKKKLQEILDALERDKKSSCELDDNKLLKIENQGSKEKIDNPRSPEASLLQTNFNYSGMAVGLVGLGIAGYIAYSFLYPKYKAWAAAKSEKGTLLAKKKLAVIAPQEKINTSNKKPVGSKGRIKKHIPTTEA